MKRNKKSVMLRNQLSALAFAVECGAMYDSTLTNAEREHISKRLKELTEYIDKQIGL